MIVLDAGHGAYRFYEDEEIRVGFQRPLLYVYKQKLQFLGSFSFQSLDACFEKEIMNIENWQKENFLYREDFGTLEIAKYLKNNSKFKDYFIFSRSKIFESCNDYIFRNIKEGARKCIDFRIEKIRKIEEESSKHNSKFIDLILSIHSNACNDLGFNQIEILYYSRKAEEVAKIFQKYLKHFEKVKLIKRSDLAILRRTKSRALIIECFYHTNPRAIRRFFQHIDAFKNLIDEAINEAVFS